MKKIFLVSLSCIVLVACSTKNSSQIDDSTVTSTTSSAISSTTVTSSTNTETQDSSSTETESEVDINNSNSDNSNKEESTSLPPYQTDSLNLNANTGQQFVDEHGVSYRDGFYISYSTANAGQTACGTVFQLKDGYVVDKTLILEQEEAKLFLVWIREVAPDGTTVNGLVSNYNYWKDNVKE